MNTAFDKLSSRVQYYLLDYKDGNKEEVFKMFGTYRLRDLSRFNLKILFKKANEQDLKSI